MFAHSTIKLTLREKEVLECLAKGLTTNETAQHLYVSHETVKTHRSNLLAKLDARNAFQLGLKTMQMKLLEHSNWSY